MRALWRCRKLAAQAARILVPASRASTGRGILAIWAYHIPQIGFLLQTAMSCLCALSRQVALISPSNNPFSRSATLRILDNINDWAFILEHRALLQANTDFHKLGESQTGVFSYTVFLWATPVAITLDLDVDSQSAFECSDWLRANVLLDVLKPGDKTFLEEGRPKLRMSDMPELQLDIVL